MNQFDRIFPLHIILSRRRSALSLQTLAERMECSRATVFRTIGLLQNSLGAPVVFDKERDGYRYDLANGQYELPGLWFNVQELQALITIQRLLEELRWRVSRGPFRGTRPTGPGTDLAESNSTWVRSRRVSGCRLSGRELPGLRSRMS